MAAILDESGSPSLDEGGAGIYDEQGAPPDPPPTGWSGRLPWRGGFLIRETPGGASQ